MMASIASSGMRCANLSRCFSHAPWAPGLLLFLMISCSGTSTTAWCTTSVCNNNSTCDACKMST